MAIIGTFTKTSNGFTGQIETLTLKANIRFEPASKKTANAPDFRIFHEADGISSEIGAAWQKTSKEGAHYLSARLDDPSFAAPIDCRLFKTGAEQTHSLVWERSRPRG